MIVTKEYNILKLTSQGTTDDFILGQIVGVLRSWKRGEGDLIHCGGEIVVQPGRKFPGSNSADFLDFVVQSDPEIGPTSLSIAVLGTAIPVP